MDDSEDARFEALKAELVRAFAAPDSEYEPLTAAEVIARNRNGVGPAEDFDDSLGGT